MSFLTCYPCFSFVVSFKAYQLLMRFFARDHFCVSMKKHEKKCSSCTAPLLYDCSIESVFPVSFQVRQTFHSFSFIMAYSLPVPLTLLEIPVL